MGFLKNIVKNAVGEGISKGIRDAVSSAAESIIAPKAEEYAERVADSFDEATQAIDAASQASAETPERPASSLEQSLERLQASAERYEKAMESAAASAAGLAEWGEKLPGFPVWTFGGKNFSIDENYTSDEGTTYYIFSAEGATYEDMSAYVEVLKANGFVQKYEGSDQVLFKNLGGEYLVFSSVEAFNDLDVMCVGMHRTKNENDM